MKKILLHLSIFIIIVLINLTAIGQGITTGTIDGTIRSADKELLPGCIIVAIHQPSGSKYITTSGKKGDFNLPNLKVGGPYLIKISLLGYQEKKDSSVFIGLGEDLNLNYTLSNNSVNLTQVEIIGKADNVFNSNRTGASTNISTEDIQALPSVSRSINDYLRITPQANNISSGMSYAGANNRYNNFSIDGSVNNDVFGLSSSGTNGGMSGTQPISLDAIQTIRVDISPFDVKQGGFTGAGINAITRSGTNNFFGDVYYYMNNQNLVGKSVIDGSSQTNYSSLQRGISVGGPIVKDKLFFFFNTELTDRNEPSAYNIRQGSTIKDTIIRNIENKLLQVTGDKYNGGGYDPFTNTTSSQKFFIRFDWNINNSNKLTVRDNYVNASQDNLGRSISGLTFNNGGYTMKNKTNNIVLELSTRFSPKVANELRLGYTTVSDNRVCPGDPFPRITINLPATSTTPAQHIYIGDDVSSMANSLDQTITTLSDNLNIYLNKHKITIGTENELYHFKNLFIQYNYGSYTYASYNSFMDISSSAQTQLNNWDCTNYSYYYSTVPGEPKWAAQFNAIKLGGYVQDVFNIVKNVKITAGVRVDVPLFPDKPTENKTFDTLAIARSLNLATNQMPKSTPLFSPRIGFNWDVNGKSKTQIRGGAGIFTGKIPFVWLSNQYSNTGLNIAKIINLSKPVAFNPDPYNQATTVSQLGLAAATTEVDVVANNFKFAQNFRSNLAVDQKLPYEIKATVEGIYTKVINDIAYQDLTMPASTNLVGSDNRPIYATTKLYTNNYTHIMYLTNTNQGYSYTLTARLQKEFKFGLNLIGAYTYGQAFSVNDGTSSVAFSNWQYNYQYQATNNPEMSYSSYALKNRIMAVVTYKLKTAKNSITSFGIFYNGQSGIPYSYIYNGDLNRDGSLYNDLIYVPAKQSDINLTTNATVNTSPATQWTQLNNFIENDEYLKTRRGQYAERNGARTPFENHFDIRIAEIYNFKAYGKKHTIEVSFDILNFTNLLSSKWGRAYSIQGYQNELITFNGYDVNNKPTYTFVPPTTSSTWQVSDYNSRWHAQIGVKYSFN